MDIFELAKAKKLFGGGGGKREGTAIPYGQPVNRIYFNTESTKEEKDALLSQLTYVDVGLANPVSFIYANTLNGDVGNYIYAANDNGTYEIILLMGLTAETAKQYTIYNSYFDSPGGWWTHSELAFLYEVNGHNHGVYQTLMIPYAMDMIDSGTTLTEFMGVPIGTENEKIKNVLSITPF